MLIRLRAEDGFSLTELLAAMIIGIVIIFWAFQRHRQQRRDQRQGRGRTDATQRGRAAMDEITRALRSAVCANNTPPITTATPTQVVFIADLSDGSRLPEQRQFSNNATTDTITESIVAGSGTANAVTWVATPKTIPVLTNSDPDPATIPAGAIFTYWKFSPGTAGQTLLPTRLDGGCGRSLADRAHRHRLRHPPHQRQRHRRARFERRGRDRRALR